MGELREEIANALIDDPITAEAQIRSAYRKADRILALPQIAEALRAREIIVEAVGEATDALPDTGFGHTAG